MKSSIIFAAVVAIANINALSFVDFGNTLSSYSSSSVDVLKKARSALPSLVGRTAASSGSGSSGSGKGPTCPPIWKTIVPDLTAMFLDTSNGQCNDAARAAIRAAFHDCGTWDKTQGTTGGCDGSLILAGEAFSLPENSGLQEYSTNLKKLRDDKYPSVSIADLLQVASSVAIVTCPGGPRVATYVGRKDSSSVNPPNRLPDVHASADSLFQLFQDKGFSAVDLAALLGAHSTSKSFGQSDIPFGKAQDSTPGIWDTNYYQETLTPPADVVPFASDTALAAHAVVGKEFKGFVGNQGKWTGKFADAMLKMSLLGVPGGSDPSKNLADCTDFIPKGTSVKREMRGAPINDRIR